jgi:transcriptional regulator with XRE-family HTH domain
MTPNQFHRIRLRLGLTQQALAELMPSQRGTTGHANQVTIARKESGTTPITESDVALLELLLRRAGLWVE